MYQDGSTEVVFEEFLETLPQYDQFRFYILQISKLIEEHSPERLIEAFLSTDPSEKEIAEHLQILRDAQDFLTRLEEEIEKSIEEDHAPRQSIEADMRDSLAERLAGFGFSIEIEANSAGGRCDIKAAMDGSPGLLIETKIADPIRGVGQLFGYRWDYDPKPTMVLAVPKAISVNRLLWLSCLESGVELWLVADDGEPQRMLASPKPTYDVEAVFNK